MSRANRDVLRQLLETEPPYPDLCEWDPRRMAPARLKDPYHDVASVRLISTVDGELCHVCEDCATYVSTGLLRWPSRLSPGATEATRLVVPCEAPQSALR